MPRTTSTFPAVPFYEVNAINNIRDNKFGSYLEQVFDDHDYWVVKKGREHFYTTDEEMAAKLGQCRQTIVCYRNLAISMGLFPMLKDALGRQIYKITKEVENRIRGIFKTGYDLYMKHIKHKVNLKNLRELKAKLWTLVILSLDKLVVGGCRMKRQGVLNETTAYSNTKTVIINNNNNTKDLTTVDPHEKDVVVFLNSLDESNSPPPTAGLAVIEPIQPPECLDPDLASVQVRISSEYLGNRDSKLFPKNLVKPLATALAMEFKRNRSLVATFLGLGRDVCTWMVWNAAYRMREKGISLEQAVAGTVKLVVMGTFTKPSSLEEYETELEKGLAPHKVNWAMYQAAPTGPLPKVQPMSTEHFKPEVKAMLAEMTAPIKHAAKLAEYQPLAKGVELDARQKLAAQLAELLAKKGQCLA